MSLEQDGQEQQQKPFFEVEEEWERDQTEAIPNGDGSDGSDGSDGNNKGHKEKKKDNSGANL